MARHRSPFSWAVCAALAASFALVAHDATAGAALLSPQGVASSSSTGYLGFAVAADGNTVVVGAPLESSDVGAAHVYVSNSGTWTEQARLTPSEVAADLFGTAVAISGDTALVGAFGRASDAGAVYVFVRNGTTWTNTQRLTAADAASGAEFGTSVALSGSNALVGAPYRAANGNSSGAAYAFTLVGSAWTQTQVLVAPDGASGDLAGQSVALSGASALVGAPGKGSNTGAIYSYLLSGSSWSLNQKITASDGVSGDELGYSVALQTGAALVGAPGKNGSTGAVYVLGGGPGGWSVLQHLSASDGTSNDSFGLAVSLGAVGLVGAPGHNGYTGAVYLLSQRPAWSVAQEITEPGGVAGDYFGYATALTRSTAAVGAPVRNGNDGAVSFLAVPSTAAPAMGIERAWLAIALAIVGALSARGSLRSQRRGASLVAGK